MRDIPRTTPSYVDPLPMKADVPYPGQPGPHPGAAELEQLLMMRQPQENQQYPNIPNTMSPQQYIEELLKGDVPFGYDY